MHVVDWLGLFLVFKEKNKSRPYLREIKENIWWKKKNTNRTCGVKGARVNLRMGFIPKTYAMP